MAWYDFMGDIDWGNVLGTVVKVAAPVIAARQTAKANTQAADAIQQSNTQAADTIQQSNQRAAEILAQQQERAQQILRPVADATRPGLQYMRSVMAQGDRLTPVQQAELTQRTTDFGRSAQRKFNSGRAYTEMANRFYGQNERAMREGNRQQANAAASNLASQNIGIEQARATGQNSIGVPTANLAANTGTSQAQAGMANALAAGQAGMANAQVYGQGVNDIFDSIRGFIASDEKRKSDYA